MDVKQLRNAMKETAVPQPKKVSTKKWGDVYLRALTVAEIEEQLADTEETKDKNRFARAAARVICDEKGVRIFDPANLDDIALLASQPWSLLKQVLDASKEDMDAVPSGK